MGRTQISTREIGSIQRNDVDTTTSGQAVITKIIAGANVTISSTGVDAGTGDVTINASASGGGELAQTSIIPTGNISISPSYSAVVARQFTLNSGIKLTVGLGGIFKII